MTHPHLVAAPDKFKGIAAAPDKLTGTAGDRP